MKKFLKWLTARDGGNVPGSAALSSTREMRIEYYEKALRAASGFREHCYAAWIDAKTIELTIGHTGIEGKVSVIMDDTGKFFMQDVFCFAFARENYFKDQLLKEREELYKELRGGSIVTPAGDLVPGDR
jgi:hypothetical protein